MNLWRKYRQLTHYRQILWAVFAIGLSGSISSMLMQYVGGQNPCVMCIQQRVAMMVMTLMSLIGLIFPVAKMWARTAVATLITVPAAFGGYIAAKQIYIQNLPITQQPECGAPWTFRLRGAPLFDWYEPIIRGTGMCGQVHKLFGLSLPMWALLFFAAMLVLVWGGWVYWRKD